MVSLGEQGGHKGLPCTLQCHVDSVRSVNITNMCVDASCADCPCFLAMEEAQSTQQQGPQQSESQPATNTLPHCLRVMKYGASHRRCPCIFGCPGTHHRETWARLLCCRASSEQQQCLPHSPPPHSMLTLCAPCIEYGPGWAPHGVCPCMCVHSQRTHTQAP